MTRSDALIPPGGHNQPLWVRQDRSNNRKVEAWSRKATSNRIPNSEQYVSNGARKPLVKWLFAVSLYSVEMLMPTITPASPGYRLDDKPQPLG
jgi:hypothetical protein